VSEITLFVNYYVAAQQRSGNYVDSNVHSLFPVTNTEENRSMELQRLATKDFLETKHLPNEVIETCVEPLENKRTSKWPQLERAIKLCKERGAKLLIAELGTLTSNDAFTKILLDSRVEFHCCDQPFVNQNILEALHQHAQVQRKLHGKLIREGLKMTSAKSGNPNAAEVISKVNKPKIDTAIVFAFLLQPIIADYRRKGFSQRQMVKTLNDEGFTAPEGGKWVLSQLQKVLDRVRLNEIVTECKPLLTELTAQQLTTAEIAEQLNKHGVHSLKRTTWDETQVKKILLRLEQIRDIELINRFVLDLIPLLHEFRRQQLTTTAILQHFETAGLSIRQPTVEVA